MAAMNGDDKTRRSTRLSNRVIALGLTAVAIFAYWLITWRFRQGF